MSKPILRIMQDNKVMVEETTDGARYYNNSGVLVGLQGVNKLGKVGTFVDEKNGLCEHEEVSEYCEMCKSDDPQN